MLPVRGCRCGCNLVASPAAVADAAAAAAAAVAATESFIDGAAKQPTDRVMAFRLAAGRHGITGWRRRRSHPCCPGRSRWTDRAVTPSGTGTRRSDRRPALGDSGLICRRELTATGIRRRPGRRQAGH